VGKKSLERKVINMEKIKCACGETAQKITTEMELFGGDVTVRNIEAYYCPKCKEEVMTTEQIQKVKDNVKSLVPSYEKFSVRKKIAQLGNSVTVPLPKEVADFLGIHKGDEVRITVKDKHRLIVESA